MLLEWARFVNVCQHADRHETFGPGITAIMGENGVGKSNLVGLIKASLTNDYSSLGGVKENNILRGKPDDEPSYVETAWTTPSGTMIVRRGLAGIRSCVLLNNEEVVPLPGKTSKETDVTQYALTMLNVTSTVVNDFMFADYDRLREIVKGTKTARAALFTSLCGIDEIEKIDRYLREVGSRDSAVVKAFDVTDLDDEQLRWQGLKTDLRSRREELKALRDSLPSEETRAETLADLQFLKDLQRRLATAKETRFRTRDLKRKVEASLVELQSRVTYMASRKKTLGDCVTRLRADVASLRSRRDDWDVTKRAFERVDAARKVAAQPRPKTEKLSRPHDVILSEVRQAIVRADAQLKLLQQHIRVARAGKATCATCLQAIDTSPEHLTSLQADLATQEAERQRLLSMEADWETYETKTADNAKRVSDWQTAVKSAKETIDSLAEIAKKFDSTDSVEQLKALLARRERQLVVYLGRVEHLDEKHTEGVQGIANYQAKLQSLTEEFDAAEAVLSDYAPVSDDEVQAAQALVDEWQETLGQITELAADLNGYQRQVATTVSRMRKLRAARRKLAQRSRWVEVAARVRAVCHRDRLPLAVINGMLLRTTGQVNRYLQSLSVPFQVELDANEFAFVAVHRDGARESAERLSTAQSLCLGIAFWLARAAVFSGQLLFFCLDEPTANLDDTRVLSVADVIGRLSAELEVAGKQGIVVTHHAAVAKNATRVINL